MVLLDKNQVANEKVAPGGAVISSKILKKPKLKTKKVLSDETLRNGHANTNGVSARVSKSQDTPDHSHPNATSMTYDEAPFTSHAPLVAPDLEKLKFFYGEMLKIRRFEEKSAQLYGTGKIGGFCHLYIGQEAVVVGIKAATIKGDAMVTGYRDHGHMLACGMDAKRVMSELTGRRDGYSGGKGGSMHIFSAEAGFYGGHGVVGTQIPIGTGLAFSFKYRDTNNVCCAFMGDGAYNQGQVYEAMNMAALWELPVVYILENNRYGMGTSVERASHGSDNLIARAHGFGIRAESVDGMNIEKMYACAQRALNYTRATQKPCLIEAKTYRYRGHSMSDPANYRTRDEVDSYRKGNDPIGLLHDTIVGLSPDSQEELQKINKDMKKLAQDASDHAINAPFPDPEELWRGIYAA